MRDFLGGAEPAHRLARDEHLAALRACGAARSSIEGVSMVPGQMQLQRMPLVMKSTATARVSAATAALVARRRSGWGGLEHAARPRKC